MTSTDALTASLGRLTESSLSTRARIGHVALLLAALGMSIVLFSLLATEGALPARTWMSFVALLAMALSWVAYATWVLHHRHTLLANHRIVAARLGLAFALVFTAGAGALVLAGGPPSLRWASALGALMVAAAVAVLVRAHRHRARLLARRHELERELGAVR